MKRFHASLALACVLLLASCHGPDPVRIASERANWRLASRCADGWFEASEKLKAVSTDPVQGLPTVDDQRLIRNALSDWDKALTADEELAQPILGGGL